MSYYLVKVLLFTTICIYLLSSQITSAQAHNKVIVCYFRSWATYRRGRGAFNIENINSKLCTHVVYTFAGLNATTNSIRPLDPWEDLPDNSGKNGYGRLIQLRESNPKIKLLISMGGWVEGSTKYSELAADPTRRKIFIRSVVKFLRKYEFDGLDFSWQYPAKRGGKPQDKQTFGELLQELRVEFTKHKWLLTAAIAAGPFIIDVAYDMKVLAKNVDLFHIMAYDYHGHWDLKSGANAPLFSTDRSSVEYSIQYLIKIGTPYYKMVLGVPTYGRTFKLLNEPTGPVSLGSPSDYNGFQGPYTKEDGLIGYNEICYELVENTNDWTVYWDELSKSPYAVSGTKVITYDNEQSIAEKIKIALKYRLAGIMVWSLDTDDFQGDCSKSGVNYPLLRAVNEELANIPPEPTSQDCFLPTYHHWSLLFN